MIENLKRVNEWSEMQMTQMQATQIFTVLLFAFLFNFEYMNVDTLPIPFANKTNYRRSILNRAPQCLSLFSVVSLQWLAKSAVFFVSFVYQNHER